MDFFTMIRCQFGLTGVSIIVQPHPVAVETKSE
jgi:hypothetical protein